MMGHTTRRTRLMASVLLCVGCLAAAAIGAAAEPGPLQTLDTDREA